MRIIHDITAPMQVCGFSRPYSNGVGIIGNNGARVELLFVTSPRRNFSENAKIYPSPREETECLEIHGGIEYVIDALKSALHILELEKQSCLERGPKRALDCPDCPEPRISDSDRYGAHTWECQAKWSQTARGLIAEDPDIVNRQREIVTNALHRASTEHLSCAGHGCDGCDWTGVSVEQPTT